MFLLQINEDSNDINEVEDVENYFPASEGPKVSLNAISGKVSPKTMRVRGFLNGKLITILMDSGSTHNFVDERLVEKAKLKVSSQHRMPVMVATRVTVSSLGRCLNVQLQMQGLEVIVDFYVLPLGGCDVVMGIE